MTELSSRALAEPDHPDVMAALEGWWGDVGGSAGAAQRTALLPRLFFQHFADTSRVVRDDARLVAFIIGFHSQSRRDEAYVHFVAVDPEYQRRGVGADLYEWFFENARQNGRTRVRAATSVENTGSQAFHRRLGFTVGDPIADYDGPGGDRVTFARTL